MNKEYALYKGDELLDMGTLDYLSKKFNIKKNRYYFISRQLTEKEQARKKEEG